MCILNPVAFHIGLSIFLQNAFWSILVELNFRKIVIMIIIISFYRVINYCVPDPVESTLYVLPHFILITLLRSVGTLFTLSS